MPAMMLSRNSDACTPEYASRLLPMGQTEQGSSAQGHLMNIDPLIFLRVGQQAALGMRFSWFGQLTGG